MSARDGVGRYYIVRPDTANSTMGPKRRVPFVHFHVRGIGGWLLKTVGGRLEADEAMALGLELMEAAIVARERARKENEATAVASNPTSQ